MRQAEHALSIRVLLGFLLGFGSLPGSRFGKSPSLNGTVPCVEGAAAKSRPELAIEKCLDDFKRRGSQNVVDCKACQARRLHWIVRQLNPPLIHVIMNGDVAATVKPAQIAASDARIFGHAIRQDDGKEADSSIISP